MRIKIIVVLILFALSGYPQSTGSYWKVQTTDSRFARPLFAGTLVRIVDTAMWVTLTHDVESTQSMRTVFDSGWYKLDPGGSGGGGDSYWQEKAGTVSLKDTTNILNVTSGDGGGRGYSIVSSSGSEFGIKAFYGSKSPSDSATIADAVRSSAVGSYDAGLFLNTMGISLLKEYTGGKSSGVGFIGEASGSPGYLHGFSDHNSGGRLNIGSSTDRWGRIYNTWIESTNIISSSGTVSTAITGSNVYGGIGINAVATTGTALAAKATSGYQFQFGNDKNTTYDSTMVQLANGKVGIGVTNRTPTEKLDVNGNIKGDTIKATGGNSTQWNTAAGWVTTNGGNVANWNTAYGWGNHADAGYLAVPDVGLTIGDMLYYSNAEKIATIPKPTTEADHQMQWIGGDGGYPQWTTLDWLKSGAYLYRMNRVGIGIENPTRWLEVAGAMKADSVFTGKIFGGTAAGDFVRVVSTTGSGTSTGPLFQAGLSTGENRFTVLNNGNVGIGTTAPGSLLTINGTAAATTYLAGNTSISTNLISGSSSSAGLSIRAANATGFVAIQTGGSTERARITETGNLGIGTTAPLVKLDVNGGIRMEGTDTTGVGSTAKVGTIQYFNGHFYGLVGGTPPTWKQLNN